MAQPESNNQSFVQRIAADVRSEASQTEDLFAEYDENFDTIDIDAELATGTW
jgi:hypothetical protein